MGANRISEVIKYYHDGLYKNHWGKNDEKKLRVDFYNAYLEEIVQGKCPRLGYFYKEACDYPLEREFQSEDLLPGEAAALSKLFSVIFEQRKREMLPYEIKEMEFYSSKDKLTNQKIVFLYQSMEKQMEESRAEPNELFTREPLREEPREVLVLRKENQELRNQLEQAVLDNEKKRKQLEQVISDYKTKLALMERTHEDLRNEMEKQRTRLDAELARARQAWEVEKNNLRQALEEEFNERRREEYEKLGQELDTARERELKRVKDEADNKLDDLLKSELKDYLARQSESWTFAHGEFDSLRASVSQTVAEAKLEGCNEASRIQRELVEQMNGYMEQFGAKMDRWRNSLYDLQLENFAAWVSKFYGLVDRLGNRFANNLADDALPEGMIKLGKTLTNIRNQLDRILPEMGLQCFYPKKGEDYDPVYHSVDSMDEVPLGTPIASCANPGLILTYAGDAKGRVLVKAEVQI